MILLIILLQICLTSGEKAKSKLQNEVVFNNVRINYLRYLTLEDSTTYNYKHIYIKDGQIKEVRSAYVDSFINSHYYRDKDSVFQVIEYVEPNFSQQPYFLKKEGDKIYAVVMQPDSTYRHLQYSLNRNDTTLWFSSPHQFSQEYLYEIGAPKCNYIGVDTTITLNNKSYKCYKFITKVYSAGTHSISEFDYRTIFVEQSTFLPLLMIWDSYNKKNELVYQQIEAAYEITPTNGFMPEERKPRSIPELEELKGK